MNRKYSFSFNQGEPWSATFVVAGVDLTGYSARGAMTDAFVSTYAVAFHAVVDGQNIAVSLTDAETAAIPAGTVVLLYDVELYDTMGIRPTIRIVEGTARMNPEATR